MLPKHGSPHTTHKLLSVSQTQHPHPLSTHHSHAHAHPLPPSPQSHTHIDIEPLETPNEREFLVTPSHTHTHTHNHTHITLPTPASNFPQPSPASAVELAQLGGVTPSLPNPIHEFPDIEMHSNDKRKSSLHNGNGSTNNLNGQSSTPPPVRILCFNLATLPKPVVFLGLSAAMCFFFLANSYVEEYLFRELPKFKYGWYMTSFELFSFAGFAVIERLAGNDDTAQQSIWSHRASYDKHLLVAVVMTLSRGLTNQSLQYLNYPTQVIFKSMKLITVMIGAVWVLQKKYNIYEYVAALLLVTSAILFSLGDSELTPNFHVLGIIIVLISLVFDAAHSTTQENLMNKHGASTLEAVMFTNAFAGTLALLVVIVTGELIPALTFCWQYPQSYYLFCFRALFVYGGVLCFVVLIQTHGVVVATSVTTVRKILTILLSFYNFPKPWVAKYMYGLLTFAAAVILGAYNDTQNKKQKAAELEKKLHEEKQIHHHTNNNNIPHHSQRGHSHEHEEVALLHRAHSIKST